MGSQLDGTSARGARAWLWAAIATAILTTATAGPASAAICLGDCGGDAGVTVEELVHTARIGLGLERAGQCPGTGTAGAVVEGDLIVAVRNALDGCPDFSGAYATSLPLDAGRSAEVTLDVDETGVATGLMVIHDPPTARRQAGAAAGSAVSGNVDLATGEFLLTGSFDDGQGHVLEIRVSGRLPRNGDPGSLMIQIGSTTYGGPFVPPPAPTPTATPLSGTVHTVEVGKTNLPFDPEVVEIDPGDTVTWVWVGGEHSVVSSTAGPFGSPHCGASGEFDSGPRTSGSFSHRFDVVGTYEYHCGVADHCEAFESGVVIVRGTPTPTATITPTATPTFALPTVTPTSATVSGVAVGMIGFFHGPVLNDFGGSVEDRIQIHVDDFGPFVADLTGYIFGVQNVLRLTIESPTKLSFATTVPYKYSIVLELQGDGTVKGVYTVDNMGTDYHLRFQMPREPSS